MKNKVIIYGCLGIVLCFIMSIPIVNDYCAYMVEKELCATPLPENTQLIDSVSKAGKLTGNGNGMQYLGAILIKSGLAMEQLDSYYSHYRENKWEYLVTVQTGCDLSFIELDQLRFLQEVTADGYYIVYSWGKGIELYEMLDMRGH